MTEATRAASQRDWSRRSGVLVAADVLFPLLVFGAVKLAEGTDQYRRFVGEDGVLEWLQVAAFVFTAGLLVDLARRTRATTRRLAVGAALMVIVVIGEELAWGTRLFGSGAEVIQRHNEQGDTTLHNLGGGLETSFAAVTLVAVALGMLVLARRPPFHRVPISVVWWLVIPAVYAAYRLLAGEVSYETSKYSEAAELVFAMALVRLTASARIEILVAC